MFGWQRLSPAALAASMLVIRTWCLGLGAVDVTSGCRRIDPVRCLRVMAPTQTVTEGRQFDLGGGSQIP